MVPVLVESLESLIQNFCNTFILSDKMEEAESTIKLSKLDITDKNILKRDFEFRFAIKHDLRALKKAAKIGDSRIYTFKILFILFCMMNQITQSILSCRSTCFK